MPASPLLVQGILIPWDSEGLATPLQQTKEKDRLREDFGDEREHFARFAMPHPAGRGPFLDRFGPILIQCAWFLRLFLFYNADNTDACILIGF